MILNLLRLLLAVAWTLAWGAARWARYLQRYPGWPRRRRLAFMWGRCESPKAMRCHECGWTGPMRWAIHTYEASGHDDVEPVDRCPSCDADALWPALWPGKGGWAS